MAKDYRQLTRLERRVIKEGLDHRESFRAIARELERSPSTISREVRANRVPYRGKSMKIKCPDRRECEKTALCGEKCIHPHLWCVDCKDRDCRELCEDYALKRVCPKITRAPWVCNGCSKLTYGCNRPCRVVYNVVSADEASNARRSESRSGIATTLADFETVVARIKEGLSRGLSPYEISTLFADEVDVSASTIYRWVEAGYGDMANIELERKVGFRPRRKKPQKKSTSHSRYRSYEAFCALSDEERASRTEMDTMEGSQTDVSCILTLYYLPCKIQFLQKLADKTSSEIKRALKSFRSVCPPKLFEAMFSCVLTDNGGEFSRPRKTPDSISAIPASPSRRAGARKTTPRCARSSKRGCFPLMRSRVAIWPSR